MHSSLSREMAASRVFPQPRLLHVAVAGISASGSSDSSSGGSSFGVVEGVGCWATVRLGARGRVTGIGAAATVLDACRASGFGGGVGVSSTVECLPVVQGGMARNSSKVKTRGLQHIQPVVDFVSLV